MDVGTFRDGLQWHRPLRDIGWWRFSRMGCRVHPKGEVSDPYQSARPPCWDGSLVAFDPSSTAVSRFKASQSGAERAPALCGEEPDEGEVSRVCHLHGGMGWKSGIAGGGVIGNLRVPLPVFGRGNGL